MRDCPKCGAPLVSPYIACEACSWTATKTSGVRLTAAHKPADLSRKVWTKEEWRANQEACRPWVDKCKQILRAAELKHRNDAMPHILSSRALAGISYDAEAVAEREAIQSMEHKA